MPNVVNNNQYSPLTVFFITYTVSFIQKYTETLHKGYQCLLLEHAVHCLVKLRCNTLFPHGKVLSAYNIFIVSKLLE